MAKPKLQDTLAIIMRAYVNGELIHNSTAASAVGHIIAKACKYKVCVDFNNPRSWYEKFGHQVLTHWYDAMVYRDNLPWVLNHRPLARKQLLSTGYLPEELVRIEDAFEQFYAGQDIAPLTVATEDSLRPLIKELYTIHHDEVRLVTREWVNSVIAPMEKDAQVQLLMEIKQMPPVNNN